MWGLGRRNLKNLHEDLLGLYYYLDVRSLSIFFKSLRHREY